MTDSVTYTRIRDGKTQIVTRNNNAHGESKTPLYRLWKAMVRRCESDKAHNYKWYGAKGVKVCDEWRTDYTKFRDWALANGYVRYLELDRINSDGNYCPENCRWITKKTNIRARDLYWDEELDNQLIMKAKELGIDPYALIEQAVRKYLQSESKGVTALCL
jgi:hypothetical protein